MKMFFSVLVGKIIVLIGKIFKKGSSKPGSIVLKMDEDFMKKIKLPKTVIAVTGSSGKGSISSMIAYVYRKCGYTVAHNSKGSNLSAGIATLLVENCSLTGKIKKDVLVYEVDERYAKYVFPYIKPNYVVISNICRDQPPRQGNVDLVYEEIKKSLTNDMHLILNGDDPYLQKFILDGYNATYYGIAQNKYTYPYNPFRSLNISYCPKCGGKLKYNFYHFESLGDYYCEKCDFKRPNIQYEVTDLDYFEGTMVINKKYNINLSFSILYNIYNTLAAFTLFGICGLDLDKITTEINTIKTNKKINSEYLYTNDRIVRVLSNKNENNTTFNQSILYTKRFNGKKVIIIGWKEISRRYEFNDISWLYDIDFEILNDENLEQIICVGVQRFDLAVRMKYANIDLEKIKVFENLSDSVNYIKNNTYGDIYAILNFDYIEPFNKLMNGGGR